MSEFKRQSWIWNGATVLTTAIAVFMIGLNLKRLYSQHGVPTEQIASWRNYTIDGHRIGPSGASVTIVEFADFECPACRRAARALESVRQQYPNEVAIVYRHFPLPIHRNALAAAHAAECAARFDRLKTFRQLLFTQADSLGSKTWGRFAAEAGVLDLGAFERCLEDTTAINVIDRDHFAGQDLGITGTPALLINDLLVHGFPGHKRLAKYVRDALRETDGTAFE